MWRRLQWIIVFMLPLIAGAWFVRGMLWPRIDVVHPVYGDAVQAVYATGTVEATVMMPIAPRSGARLIALNADEGSQVTKGQILAQMEDQDLRHTTQQLHARELYARQQYDRAAHLVKTGFMSKAAFDQAKSELEAAQSASQASQAQENYLKLLAPADGLIIKRDGEVGQTIPANEPVFWLSCCAPLRISVEVDEEDIAKVQPGQRVLIRADAFPEEIFHGKVQAITPKGDPIARSYRVRVHLTDTTPLQIGMTTETNIVIGERKHVLLVPSSAIIKEKVWLVKQGELVHQTVQSGIKGIEQTEIKQGITTDDLVVMTPSTGLEAGRKVQARLRSTGS